jgi:phosphoenolpyruvate carboxykinase (GTP)
MADYWKHWLHMGERIGDPPLIFRVNWFRKGENGEFLWPGFSNNMRVLKWIVDRVHGRGSGAESPFGTMPRHRDINWEGLEYDVRTFHELMQVDRAAGQDEAEDQRTLFDRFGDRLPKEFERQRELLIERLEAAPEVWELEG